VRECQAKAIKVIAGQATVIAEQPKLAPHIEAMRERLAGALGLPAARVSVKASTNERMGAIGREISRVTRGIGMRVIATRRTATELKSSMGHQRKP
jgi:2-C-methyl-D-erythritol 2,4-cyclodiphosphate synthase